MIAICLPIFAAWHISIYSPASENFALLQRVIATPDAGFTFGLRPEGNL